MDTGHILEDTSYILEDTSHILVDTSYILVDMGYILVDTAYILVPTTSICVICGSNHLLFLVAVNDEGMLQPVRPAEAFGVGGLSFYG